MTSLDVYVTVKYKSLLLMPRAVEKLWALSSPLYIPLKGTEWSSHNLDRPTPISDLSWYTQFISRRMRMAGHVARWGEKRYTNRGLLGKPEVNRPLARWEHNIKLSLQVEWEFVHWIRLDEDKERQRDVWPRQSNYGFRIMRGFSLRGMELVASSEGICCVELVIHFSLVNIL
jgi:hypothetical protein